MELKWFSWEKGEVYLQKKGIFVDFNFDKETTLVEHGKLFSAVGRL